MITVLSSSSDDSTRSTYETTVGPIGFLRIMWDFWRHNGTGLGDWARITAFIEKEKEENESHTNYAHA